MSPVKCKLISSIGNTCAYPPPAAPPLIPITGPSEGSRNAITDFLLILLSASPNPTVIVDFPSPAGVGLMEVTKIKCPSALSFDRLIPEKLIFALYFPYSSKSSSLRSNLLATSTIGSSSVSCEICRSFFI